MKTVAVELRNVRVEFPLSFDFRPSLKGAIGGRVSHIFNRNRKSQKSKNFVALDNINLTVYNSDIVGIIGPNGGGKTTLLRTIGGIYSPDFGEVSVFGKLSTLLSLGTGFNNEMSGRDNVLMGGLLMGLSSKEIDGLIDTIISYADLGDFINVPMKYYSNGMFSRLGFAIAMASRSDILLVDEVFSVGDLEFQKKSEKTMKKLLDDAKCQLIVTHNLSYVKAQCNRAVWVQSGKIVYDGNPEETVARYENSIINADPGQ